MGWFKRLLARSPADEAPPQEGEERTGTQAVRSGELRLPIPGSIERFQAMRCNPTIALARAAATLPVRAQKWAYQADDDLPKAGEALDLVRYVMDPLERPLVRNMLFGVDYGAKAFEKVWERLEGKRFGGKLGYKTFKPLAGKKTKVLVNDDGTFGGLINDETTLETQYCFLYSHDREDDDYRGRSRMKNVEKEWEAWNKTLTKQDQYFDLVSVPKPMIEYPPGKGYDRTGVKRSNYEIAEQLRDQLMGGKGVFMPNALVKYARDLLERGIDPTKLRAWLISFIEAKGQHGGEFVETLRHFESLMMRGWLVPERAVVEGQMGTKAEATAHAKLAMSFAQELRDEIIRHVNWYAVDPLVAYNFGEEYRGSVWITASPLVDEQAAMLNRIIEAVLSENPKLMQTWLDIDAVLDQAGLPKLDQVIEQEEQEDTDTDTGEDEDVDEDEDTDEDISDEDDAEKLAASLRLIFNRG